MSESKHKRDWENHSAQSNDDYIEAITGTDDDFEMAYPALKLSRKQLEELYGDIVAKMDSTGLVKPTANRSYPTVSRRWGDLKVHTDSRGRQHSQREQITWTSSHIVKLWNDEKPKVPGLEISHLCHVPSCCDNEHLVWEFHGRNMKRNGCFRGNVCVCGLTPNCVLNQHD